MESPWLMQGDCLDRMKEIPDGSVDLILSDPPYGTTKCKWDVVIPFQPMWNEYKRISSKGCPIILHSNQPFTSCLVSSNISHYRHCYVWDKVIPSGFQTARFGPMRQHEDICVFGFHRIRYIALKTPRDKAIKGKPRGKPSESNPMNRSNNIERTYHDKHPTTILRFRKPSSQESIHPTQKPVGLAEFLISSYSDKGALVLDNTMGSGTTIIAALNTGRRAIGIEKEDSIFDMACKRIQNHIDGVLPTKKSRKKIDKGQATLFD